MLITPSAGVSSTTCNNVTTRPALIFFPFLALIFIKKIYYYACKNKSKLT